MCLAATATRPLVPMLMTGSCNPEQRTWLSCMQASFPYSGSFFFECWQRNPMHAIATAQCAFIYDNVQPFLHDT